MISCRSFAKVNLTLDVLERRADGYHELQSVVHAVGLWDVLHFEFSGAGFSLRCNDAELENDDNLCLRAARAWQKAANIAVSGLKITLQKSIPAGAGLGGGSGNAAATLRALNRHFDDCLGDAELLYVAASLGADVPFFLRGGCALMEGIGEKLSPLPAQRGWLVLVQPERGLSTPAVYRRWDEMNKSSLRATPALLAALQTGALEAAGGALGNDLAAAAQSLGVDVAGIAAALRQNGAADASMTGSGSCVFGLFSREEAARAAAERLRASGERSLFHRCFVAPLVAADVEFRDVPLS
jgi:4-diphosphocytidyl-2-C-methyl-D-erythritol kinase